MLLPWEVLLLDGHPVLRHLMAPVLIDAGFSVLEGTNGRQGLALSKAYRRDLGIVIVAIEMAQLDGLQFARAFRKQFVSTPILFTSSQPDRHRPIPFTNCDVLEKPFGPDRFLAAVHRLLAAPLQKRSISGTS